MSLTNLLVPTFMQMLRSLNAWLEKAASRHPDTLMSLRLTDDMYPLSAQVRFICFQAQEPIYRLRSEALPEAMINLRQGGYSAGEQPGTLKDAQNRIADAISFLNGLAPDTVDHGATQSIALDLPNGIIFDMTGEQYVRDWALPQFYFHLVTAYGILRHHGVDLGKPDYVAHMFAYMRRG